MKIVLSFGCRCGVPCHKPLDLMIRFSGMQRCVVGLVVSDVSKALDSVLHPRRL